MLSHSEWSAFGSGVFFLLQLGSFDAGSFANTLCVAAILANLAALASLQACHALSADSHGSFASRRIGLFPALAVALAAAAFLVAAALPATKQTVLAALDAALLVITAIFELLMRIIVFLLSLAPEPGEHVYDIQKLPDLPIPGAQGGEAEIQLPSWVGDVLLAVAAAGAVSLVIWALMQLSRLRLKAPPPESDVQMQRGKTLTARELLRQILRELLNRLELRRRLMRNYQNCAGVFLRVERAGRRRGFPRAPSQSPREYLAAVAARIESAQPGHPAQAALAALAEQIDLWCFAAGKRSHKKLKREMTSDILCGCRLLRRQRSKHWK
jgi:heme/copper-type cytochrome/quinol oxidase subunit 4